jgi:hypothetical protein
MIDFVYKRSTLVFQILLIIISTVVIALLML